MRTNQLTCIWHIRQINHWTRYHVRVLYPSPRTWPWPYAMLSVATSAGTRKPQYIYVHTIMHDVGVHRSKLASVPSSIQPYWEVYIWVDELTGTSAWMQVAQDPTLRIYPRRAVKQFSRLKTNHSIIDDQNKDSCALRRMEYLS